MGLVDDDDVDRRVINLDNVQCVVDAVCPWHRIDECSGLRPLQASLGDFARVERTHAGKDGLA